MISFRRSTPPPSPEQSTQALTQYRQKFNEAQSHTWDTTQLPIDYTTREQARRDVNRLTSSLHLLLKQMTPTDRQYALENYPPSGAKLSFTKRYPTSIRSLFSL